MDNVPLLLVACALYGLACGLFLPRIVQEVVAYKCRQYDRTVPAVLPDTRSKAILVVAHVLLCAGTGLMVALPQAVFICLFVSIALVGALVDHSIRLIPNELLAVLLVVGIAYRLVDGGPQSLLGSLMAFGLVAVVFFGSMFITKLIKGERGVGAGDIKLALVIAIAVGYPGVLYFGISAALAILAYCMVRISRGTLAFSSYFPMCAHLMVGLVAALLFLNVSPLNFSL